jgi:hypothetical protein
MLLVRRGGGTRGHVGRVQRRYCCWMGGRHGGGGGGEVVRGSSQGTSRGFSVVVPRTPVALDHVAGGCSDRGEEVSLQRARCGSMDELVLTYDSFTPAAVGKNKRLSKGYVPPLAVPYAGANQTAFIGRRESRRGSWTPSPRRVRRAGAGTGEGRRADGRLSQIGTTSRLLPSSTPETLERPSSTDLLE